VNANLPESSPTVVDYRTPEYWAAVRKTDPKAHSPSLTAVVIEPAVQVSTTPCASARWYLENAGGFGWAVRATRARHRQPPAVSGNYAHRWAEYVTIAVRLLHRTRNLSAWGVWQYDPEGSKGKGQWSFSEAMWAYVPQWTEDGLRPVRVLILKARAGSYSLAAAELKSIVMGVAYVPPERRKSDEPTKPRKKREPSPSKRVMA
jgi:hypothetical protein